MSETQPRPAPIPETFLHTKLMPPRSSANLVPRAALLARLVHASAGGAMEIDCQAVAGNEVKLNAGRDIRVYIRDLTGAQIRVNDLGGYWEGRIGDGQIRLICKAGGDVTLVTDQEVVAQPPDFILGKVERPG